MMVISYKITKLSVSVYIPSPSSSLEEGILEEIDSDTYEILKIGSKLPVYEGGRIPIRNFNGRGNALEVANL